MDNSSNSGIDQDTQGEDGNDEEQEESKKTHQGLLMKDLVEYLEGILPQGLDGEVLLPQKFKSVVARKEDVPLIIEVSKDNTAELVSVDYVATCMRSYLKLLVDKKKKKYNLPTKRLYEPVEEWRSTYRHMKELPKAIGFLSDKDTVFHRMGFDPKPIDRATLEKEAPIFSDYLSRMTNADAFCARVGSIFDLRANRKQVIWITGEKDCGKTNLIEFLAMMVGTAYVPIDSDSFKEKYWKEPLIGKRVALVDDATPEFLRTTNFKRITGGKLHQVRPFGGKSFQAKLEPLFFFTSNADPEMPNDDALIGRVIFCHIQKIKQRMAEYKILAQLAAEMPFIGSYCWSKWKEVPEGDEITTEKKDLAKVVDNFEGPYLDFIANYLEIEPEGFRTVRYYAELTHIQKLMINAEIKSNAEQSICKRVILSQRNVSQARITPPNSDRRVNCYLGLRIRPEHHNLMQWLMNRWKT